jgi:hypothetical protein
MFQVDVAGYPNTMFNFGYILPFDFGRQVDVVDGFQLHRLEWALNVNFGQKIDDVVDLVKTEQQKDYQRLTAGRCDWAQWQVQFSVFRLIGVNTHDVSVVEGDALQCF